MRLRASCRLYTAADWTRVWQCTVPPPAIPSRSVSRRDDFLVLASRKEIPMASVALATQATALTGAIRGLGRGHVPLAVGAATATLGMVAG